MVIKGGNKTKLPSNLRFVEPKIGLKTKIHSIYECMSEILNVFKLEI